MQASANAPEARRILSVATTASTEQGIAFAGAAALAERLRGEARALGSWAWLLVWLDHAVLLGVVDGNGVHTQGRLEPGFLQELRLFNAAGEWRVWRTGEGFAARRRHDGVGAAAEVLEDDQSLWGTDLEQGADGWTVVREDRGIAYAVPHRLHGEDLPLRLRLRHYLASDASGMVGVRDSRLAALCGWSGEPLAWEEDGQRGPMA